MSEISQAPDKAPGGYFSVMLPCLMRSALIWKQMPGYHKQSEEKTKEKCMWREWFVIPISSAAERWRRYNSEKTQGGSSPSPLQYVLHAA